jgi:hypothetical protein
MFLTVPDSILESMLHASQDNNGRLYGCRLDDGDVVQVWGIDEIDGIHLGCWFISETLALPDTVIQQMPPDGEVVMIVSNTPQLCMSAYQVEAGQLQAIPGDIIRLHADFASRLRGLFEVDRLAEACVTIIGLGTGGSMTANLLARCGVGHMRLVDFDRLEVHNIARHVCDMRDIGRYKTRALRDLLCHISPVIQIETYEANILEQFDILEKAIDGCDIVVAATDSEQSKVAINSVCWPRSIPAVYGAAYNRAFGGDIFRAIPPDGACYNCFQAVVTEFFGSPPAATDDLSPGYADPERMADLIAEPGLGVDAGMIALLMTQVTLSTLLHTMNLETTLPDTPTNWLLFGNRAEWIFQKPLESMFIDVPKQSGCPTCGDYAAHHLDMTQEEATTAAEKILAETPIVDSPLKKRN